MYSISTHGLLTGFTSEALDINSQGVVVGALHPVAVGNDQAFVWGSSLSILPDNGHGAEARVINDDGIIGGAVNTSPGRFAAATWDLGHNLTLLKEPQDSVVSFVHGLDSAGRFVGGYWKPGPRQVPLYWPSATAVPIPAPLTFQWSEALAVSRDQPWACGTIDDNGHSFLWDLQGNMVSDLGSGAAVVIRGTGNEAFGASLGKPAQWHGGPPAVALPGLAGMPDGSANDSNKWDETVGDVHVNGMAQISAGFLRRRFRRDELDPMSSPLLPQPLQLTSPETIDLNTLLPFGAGWQLLGASAINVYGAIAGTGIHGGHPCAYRLTPPKFESGIGRLLTLAQVMAVFGQVAAGGGGFGITPSGHIIPIPPPLPFMREVNPIAMLREALAAVPERARTSELVRAVEGAIEEAARALKSQ